MALEGASHPDAAVLPRTAVLRRGRLRAIGGVDLDELAAEHGTPLYVLDEAELRGRMRAYRAAFGEAVAITYAAKALCVVGVLQIAVQEGLHVDVASGGELHTALVAGVPGDRLVLHGNNKSVEELTAAVDADVGRVVVDSSSEIARLSAVAAAAGRDVDVLVRVTPGIEAHTHAFIATGHDDSKFGFPLSTGQAYEAVEQVLAAPGLRLRGVHCHIGSQIFAPEGFSRAAEVMVGLLAQIRARTGAVLDDLNLGGGLGIAYDTGDQPLPLPEYARALLGAARRELAAADLPEPRVWIEPGRSVVGPAGCTLYRVGTIKDLPGIRTYVSVDGGMSDNLRPALYDARYRFVAAGEGAPVDALHHVTVAGKHCESGDVLGRDVELPVGLAEGELLAAAATGAYTHAMANNYNRLARPAMVLVGNGRARLLVRRETFDDVLARDVPLEGCDPPTPPT